MKLFHQRLVGCGICPSEPVREENADPALVTAFRDWFQTHRGVKPPTLRLYARGAAELLQALGEDVGQWTAHAVRNFLLQRASQCGAQTTQKLITSLRAFLRYLNFHGESRDDLALAIPAVAHWRLAKLPRCLSSEEVNRLIAACDGADPGRLRDRAIVLILVTVRIARRRRSAAASHGHRLEWRHAASDRERTIPGTATASAGCRRCGAPLSGMAAHEHSDTDQVFVRSIAPYRPFASGDGVSSVVRHALKRASIETPAKGAHLLRHTAATEMLRNGVPLDQAGLVLRHRSIDMTAYYAKADVALLKQIAQPWPGVNR